MEPETWLRPLVLLAVFVIGSFGALLFIASTSRVLVFRDWGELVITNVVLNPIIWSAVFLLCVPGSYYHIDPQGIPKLDWHRYITEDAPGKDVSVGAAMMWLVSWVYVFATSMSSNGFTVGAVVAVLKIVSSAFIILLASLTVLEILSKKGRFAWYLRIVEISIFLSMLSILVNGDAVDERRAGPGTDT